MNQKYIHGYREIEGVEIHVDDVDVWTRYIHSYREIEGVEIHLDDVDVWTNYIYTVIER